MQLFEPLNKLATRQLVWGYRAWVLDMNARTVPKMLNQLSRQKGFMSFEDINQILLLLANHCVFGSLASSYAIKQNIGGNLSDVGLEFANAVDELNHKMVAFERRHTDQLIEQFLWIETTGWLAAKMAVARYAREGMLPSIAPVLSLHSSNLESKSHSAMNDLLFGFSNGRVTANDARQLLKSIVNTSMFDSGIHFRASAFLAANPGWTPTWPN